MLTNSVHPCIPVYTLYIPGSVRPCESCIAVNRPGCYAPLTLMSTAQADTGFIYGHLKSLFSSVYKLDHKLPVTASFDGAALASNVPVEAHISMADVKHRILAAIAEHQAAVQQRVSGLDSTVIDPHIHPDTPTAASHPRPNPSPTRQWSQDPPQTLGIQSTRSLLCHPPKVHSGLSPRPAVPALYTATAGALGEGLPSLNQVAVGGLAAGQGGVAGASSASIPPATAADTPGMPATHTAAPRHPEAELPIEDPFSVDQFLLFDELFPEEEDMPPVGTEPAGLQGMPVSDSSLGSQASPGGLRERTPAAPPQQQQQARKGERPQLVPMQQQMAPAPLGPAAQASAGASEVWKQSQCHAQSGLSGTAAVNTQTTTALQQSQQATYVVTGPTANEGAQHRWATEQDLQQILADAIAADQQACKGGLSTTLVGGQPASAGGWSPAAGRQLHTADTQPDSRPNLTANSHPPFSHDALPRSEGVLSTMTPQSSTLGVSAGRQLPFIAIATPSPLPHGHSPTANEGLIPGRRRSRGQLLQRTQSQWTQSSLGSGLRAPAPADWIAPPQHLPCDDPAAAMGLSAVNARPSPAAANSSLAARTHVQPMHGLVVVPQQRDMQRLVTGEGPPGARSHDQPGSVGEYDTRRQPGSRVQGTVAVRQGNAQQAGRKRSRDSVGTTAKGGAKTGDQVKVWLVMLQVT